MLLIVSSSYFPSGVWLLSHFLALWTQSADCCLWAEVPLRGFDAAPSVLPVALPEAGSVVAWLSCCSWSLVDFPRWSLTAAASVPPWLSFALYLPLQFTAVERRGIWLVMPMRNVCFWLRQAEPRDKGRRFPWLLINRSSSYTQRREHLVWKGT